MTALAHRPAAFEIRNLGVPHVQRGDWLRLSPTEDGWSLINPQGKVVFRGLGVEGRRACLEFARDHGVPMVLS